MLNCDSGKPVETWRIGTMEKLRSFLQKPRNSLIVGILIGLIIGLPILGWGLMPVKWVDADPSHLRADLQKDYLMMAIQSYTTDADVNLAKRRWDSLGDKRDSVLEALKNDPASKVKPENITDFTLAVTGKVPTTPAGTALPTATPTTSPGGGSNMLLLVVLLVGLLGVGGFLAWNLFFKKAKQPTQRMQAATAAQAYATQQASAGEETPMTQFMTGYKLGTDLYDDAFSIDSPTGEFLGECGVGISKTIGVGDPKKVTAFEVWLFDKNDIQTVTKVLMSEHAFNNEDIAQELAAKGEPVLLEPGKQILLETASLQLEVRVTDMGYGQGALPEKSFFERLNLYLAIWPKSAG
jgi:type II secretory pathway pseudopilin PulG